MLSMPSLLPAHNGQDFTDADVVSISLDGVNEIEIKPVGGDIYMRLDGTDPVADGSQDEDWPISAGVKERFTVGHAASTLKIIGQTGESGTVKVYGARNAQDNQ